MWIISHYTSFDWRNLFARQRAFFLIFTLTALLGCSYCQAAESLSNKNHDALSVATELGSHAFLRVGSSAGSLAAAITKATGKATIVVLPQQKKFEDELLKSQDGDNVTWEKLQTILRKSGAVIINFKDTNVLGVVQGRGYSVHDETPPNCNNSKNWQDFFDAYRKLSPAQQDALPTPEGVTIPIPLNNIPAGLQQLIAITQFQFKAGHNPSRLQIRLIPNMYTGFADPPSPYASSWWYWDDSDANSHVVYPNNLRVLAAATYPWSSKALHFNSENISSPQVITELSRVTGAKIQVKPNLEWPSIGIAGEPVTAGELLQCIKAATAVEARFFPKENLLYITTPLDKPRFARPFAFKKADYPIYLKLLDITGSTYKIDWGPLPYGVLQIPTNSMPNAWIIPILSGIPPEKALQQIGVSPQVNPEMTEAAQKWLTIYGDSSVASIPSFGLLIQYQESIGADAWIPIAGEVTSFFPLCA